MMEFASRYVLERSLIKRTVETFAAGDRQTQERVMVHVFSASEHGLNPSSLPEEVLQKFHELTRAQVRIRAVGVDPGTKYAYVVTPEIDTEYVSVWGMEPPAGLAPFSTAIIGNQFGDVSARTPEERDTPPAQPEPAVLEPYVQALETPSVGEPGAFTKEFLALQSRAAQPAPAAPAAQPAAPALTKPFAAQQERGISKPASHPDGEPSLTAVLRAVDAASGHPELSSPLPADEKRKAVPDIAPPPALPAAPAKAAASDGPSFTALFSSAPAAPAQASPAVSARPVETAAKPQAGAFTAMFGAEEAKSHLQPPAPPIPVAPASAAPRPGAFTAMFGAEEAKAHLERPRITPPAPPPPVAPAPKAGAFTAMFGSEQTKAHLEPKPVAGAFTRIDAPGLPPNRPAVPSTPAAPPPVAAAPPAPAFPPVASAPASNAPASPATRFFKGADAVSATPAAPVIPAGPSEYTRVVKFSDVVKQAAPAVPPGAGVPPAGVPANINVSGPSFSPPVMPGYPPAVPQVPGVQYQPPQMPQYVPPQMPAQPYGVPAMQPPQMPQYQAPQFQAPPAPAQSVPDAGKPKSWMPLVILFLGLTVLALLVVLLFALKGH